MADRKEKNTTILKGDRNKRPASSRMRDIAIKNTRFSGLGIGGQIAKFERTGKPPIIFKWKAAYMRGAGKGIKSRALRESVRGEAGPKFRIKVRF